MTKEFKLRCLRCGTENPDDAINCTKCKTSLKRVCPRCRAINDLKQVFCGNCALKLVNTCPRCKAQNPPLQRFCGNCGLKIINFCPRCGLNNPVNQRFCGNCATRLLPDQTSRAARSQDSSMQRQPQKPPQGQSLPQRGTQKGIPVQKQLPPERQAKHPQQIPPYMRQPQPKKAPTASEIGKQLRDQKKPAPTPEKQEPKEVKPPRQQTPPPEKQEPKEVKPPRQQTPPPEKQEQKEVKPPRQQTPPPEKQEQKEVKPPPPPPAQTQKPLPESSPKHPVEEIIVAASDSTQIIGDNPSEIKLDDIEQAEESTNDIDTFIEVEEEPEIEEISSEEFEDSQKESISPVKELVRFAVMSIEIVNYSSLAEILDKNTLDNIKNKIWKIARDTAHENNEELVEVSGSIGVIPFAHAENKQNSSITSINVSSEIFKLIRIFNQQVEPDIKIKMGLAFNDTEGVSQLERSIASGWSIVVSEEIKKDTEGIFNYDTIGPLPIGNQMVTFYKLKVEDVPDTRESLDYDKPLPQKPSAPSSDVKKEHSKQKEQDMPVSPPKIEDKEPLPEIKTKTLEKDAIVNNLVNTCHLVDSQGKGEFISVIAEDGMGKSTIIRQLKNSVPAQTFTWMICRCNFVEQQMPFSAIKDMLRNYFSLTNLVFDREEAKNIIKQGVEAVMGANDQICYVLNSLIIGDEITGLTKAHIISTLFSFLKAISEKNTVVIIVEDLDVIDNTSFEVLETLLEARILDNKVLLISTYHPNLNFVESKPHLVKIFKYTQMAIKPLSGADLDMVIHNTVQTGLQLPDNIREQLIACTNMVPFAIENALYLMYELQVLIAGENGLVFNQEAAQWEMPQNLQDLLRLRLQRLSQENPNAFMILQLAATLGPKFSPVALSSIAQGNKQLDEIVQYINSLGFLFFEDQNTIVFKHNIIWELIYYAAIPGETRSQYHMQILTFLEKLQQTGGRLDLACIAYHAEHAGKRRKSLNYWNLVANQVLALGLNTGYSEVMMRYINLLEESDLPNKQQLQINALEGIARVVHITDPDLAIQAFSKVIPIREQENNTPKLIELKGLYSISLEQLGRWEESIQQIDSSLELLNPETVPLERAMLLVSRLSPMENTGKVGWIINTCKNELFPILEKALADKSFPEGITEEQVFRTLCTAKIYFTSSLITLGHHEAFTVFNDLLPEIQRRGLQDIGMKMYLLNAKAHAIRGEIQNAEQILTQTKEYLQQIQGINPFSLMWAEAACYLNLEQANWDVLAGLIEGLRIQAKKLNNYPVVALSKVCSGIITQVKGKPGTAQEIFNDLVNYASQYRLTTFALMGWYYLAMTELNNKSFDKAENIILRALEVAKMPDIYNLNSIVSLNRLLGEIYIRKGDIERSGEPLEEAWKIATELQNHTQVAKVAVTIGLMYQELLSHSEENQKEYADKAYEFLSNAHNIFSQLGNQHHSKQVEKAIENLRVVCRVNSIELGG